MAEVERTVSAKSLPKLSVTDPEYTISIIGLVTAICGQPIVGLVLSIMALKRSGAAKRHNTYGLIGLIISIVMISGWVLLASLYIAGMIIGIVLSTHGNRG